MLKPLSAVSILFAAILLPAVANAGNDGLRAYYAQVPLEGGKKIRLDLFLQSSGEDRDFYVDFSKSTHTNCPSDLRTLPAPDQDMFTRTYGVVRERAWVSRTVVFVSDELIGEKCRVLPHVEELASKEERNEIELRDAQSENSYREIEPFFSRNGLSSPAPGAFLSSALMEVPKGHARSIVVSMVALVDRGNGYEMDIVEANYICSSNPRARRSLIIKDERDQSGSPLKRFRFIASDGWPKRVDTDSCQIVMSTRVTKGHSEPIAADIKIDVVAGGRIAAVGRLIGERLVHSEGN